MTSVMMHFHKKPVEAKLDKSPAKHPGESECNVLTLEGEGNSIDIFFYGDAVDALIEVVEDFKKRRISC
jgi:hypothetical protein